MFHFIHKTGSHVSFLKLNSLISVITWLIGMSHPKQEPKENGRYHDIIHRDIIHHDVMIHFALTKMADSHDCRWKNTWLLPIIYTFSGLVFHKSLTCIISNNRPIILHVHYNLKCNENGWKAAYHASSVQRVVSYAPCV